MTWSVSVTWLFVLLATSVLHLLLERAAVAALVSESDASPELGDDIAAVVSDLDRCEAAVEVLRSRVPTRNRNGNGGTSNDNCE